MGKKTAKGVLPSGLMTNSIKYRDTAIELPLQKDENPGALFKEALDALDISSAELTVLCSTENETVVRKIMQSWQAALGISCVISVEAVSEAELTKRVANKNYQLALTDVQYHTDTAFNALFRFTSDAEGNILSLRSKKYDSLVEDIKLADNLTETVQYMQKCEEYLLSIAAIIPLYEKPVYYGMSKGVSGAYCCACGDIVYFKHTLSK